MSNRINLQDHLDASRVVTLTATTKVEALAELVGAAGTADQVEDAEALLHAVQERESLLSTGIGLGIAIPHARIQAVSNFVVAVGRHKTGLEFGSIDGKPVHIVVLIAGPQDAKKPYLELLAQISKRLKMEDVRTRIVASDDPQEIVDLMTSAS